MCFRHQFDRGHAGGLRDVGRAVVAREGTPRAARLGESGVGIRLGVGLG